MTRLEYYQAHGATSDCLDDAEYEYLLVAGATPAAVQDMWFEHLRMLGYEGALSDMLPRFWEDR